VDELDAELVDCPTVLELLDDVLMNDEDELELDEMEVLVKLCSVDEDELEGDELELVLDELVTLCSVEDEDELLILVELNEVELDLLLLLDVTDCSVELDDDDDELLLLEDVTSTNVLDDEEELLLDILVELELDTDVLELVSDCSVELLLLDDIDVELDELVVPKTDELLVNVSSSKLPNIAGSFIVAPNVAIETSTCNGATEITADEPTDTSFFKYVMIPLLSLFNPILSPFVAVPKLALNTPNS